ncbi:hypothetical protein J6590_005702 [Homalodisca vitripennis]|nr:hypothetical protein J6590_005702 [Homalodisca vitripennis]
MQQTGNKPVRIGGKAARSMRSPIEPAIIERMVAVWPDAAITQSAVFTLRLTSADSHKSADGLLPLSAGIVCLM